MRDAWSRLRRDPVALFGFAVIAVAVFTALFAEHLAPWPPDRQFFDGLTLEGAPLPPNERFWLGTDLLGRDLLSRLIFGARTSLVIGVVANGVAVAIGALLGVTAGFLRGWIGTAIMRFTDLMMAFPALLLAIALAAICRRLRRGAPLVGNDPGGFARGRSSDPASRRPERDRRRGVPRPGLRSSSAPTALAR